MRWYAQVAFPESLSSACHAALAVVAAGPAASTTTRIGFEPVFAEDREQQAVPVRETKLALK